MPNEHKLYEGQVSLTMDKRHIYRVSIDGGKKLHVPNVTTILGMKAKQLLYWQRNCIKDAFIKHFPVGQKFSFDEIQRNQAVEIITKAADKIRAQAADIGTLVHGYIELRLHGNEPPLPANRAAANACRAFDDWFLDNHVEPIFIERMCYSKRHHYCGTGDLLAKVKGVVTMLDFKTSKKIYGETMLQTSGYKEALQEELGLEIEQRAALRCDKEDGSYQYLVFHDTHERDFETFLSLLRLYHFDKQANKELREMAA